jgi:hypothetical protein
MKKDSLSFRLFLRQEKKRKNLIKLKIYSFLSKRLHLKLVTNKERVLLNYNEDILIRAFCCYVNPIKLFNEQFDDTKKLPWYKL